MIKNKRNKKNKLAIIISAIVVVIIMVSAILQGISGSGYKAGGSNSDASGDWQNAINSNDKQLIYLGRPTCSWCNKIRPELNGLTDKYNIKTTYVNMDDISKSDESTLFEKLGIDSSNFGTPYLVIIENGKKATEQVGYIPEEQLFNFFQTNGLIGKNEVYKAGDSSTEEQTDTTTPSDNSDDIATYANVNFIDYNEFNTIYQGGNKSILVLGQSGCSYCNQYKPVLDTIAKENGIQINYVDIRAISEEERNNMFESLNDYFKDNQDWGTPLTLILENKSVVDSLVGYAEKSKTIEFYKENGFVK